MTDRAPPRAGTPRGRRTGLWAGVAAAAFALALSTLPAWRTVELALFDRLTVLTAPGAVELPITIVGIDEASFSAIGLAWPWPRSLHAKLLETLQDAGVALVAFDVLFSEASDAEEDRAFAEAIAQSGPVVLASDLVYSETGATRQWLRVDPHPRFREAGAITGLASVELDRDGVQRQIPAMAEAFWRQIVKAFDAGYPDVVERFTAGPEERIRYLGPPHTFPYLSYHHLLDPDTKLPPHWREALRDNIVLVGRELKATTEVGSAQADLFHTPFFSSTRELMPGVEIQANLVANMISGQTLRETGRGTTLGFMLCVALAAVIAMRRWRPLPASLWATSLTLGVFGLQYILFARALVWLPAAGSMLAVLMIFLAQGGYAYLAMQRQRRDITRAFAMYVAPALVEQIAAHPERLHLGGERRELTLMFTDLAGFTELAESMPVEEVAAVLNRHLSEMTAIVLAHDGTVDKFIGDAIMAFWGAPLPVEEAERKAVEAALAMQARMRETHDELLTQLGISLTMRIGLHRGPCIVGNLGGDNRFDFTAVGDAVNLASRLEGVNKVFGTGILLSEPVAEAVSERFPLRELDTLRVKGKQQGIRVFIPCDDPRLVARSAEALALYRGGDWIASRAAWRSLARDFPDDPVAALFVRRHAILEAQGWPTDWDGVTVLDSK